MKKQILMQIASDLHNESYPAGHAPNLARTSSDLILLAGDIDIGVRGICWAAEQSQRHGKPVLYVAGNHEYYYGDIVARLDEMREAAHRGGVHFLEQKEFHYEGVRFLGTTLWTDYRCTPSGDQLESMVASARLADHRLIGYRGGAFMPADALALHQTSRDWLQSKLTEDSPATTNVILTHHAPSPDGRNERFSVGPLDGAFCSNLGSDLLGHADLWVHGHTHACIDINHGSYRLVSNQRGYPGEENSRFEPELVIEISGRPE